MGDWKVKGSCSCSLFFLHFWCVVSEQHTSKDVQGSEDPAECRQTEASLALALLHSLSGRPAASLCSATSSCSSQPFPASPVTFATCHQEFVFLSGISLSPGLRVFWQPWKMCHSPSFCRGAPLVDVSALGHTLSFRLKSQVLLFVLRSC